MVARRRLHVSYDLEYLIVCLDQRDLLSSRCGDRGKILGCPSEREVVTDRAIEAWYQHNRRCPRM